MERRAAVLLAGAVLMAPGVAAAQIVEADLPSERWSAGVDAGWADAYDDSGLWSAGYAVGVSGYYSISTTLLCGARFGVSHWDYYSGTVERDLVPPGGELVGAQSGGQTEVLEFGALLRAERPALLPGAFGVFAHASAQVGYVKHFALTEVLYTDVVLGEEIAKYEVNEAGWRLCTMVAVGVGRPLTELSIIEVFPWYRFIFEGGEVVAVPGVSLGWRVRV